MEISVFAQLGTRGFTAKQVLIYDITAYQNSETRRMCDTEGKTSAAFPGHKSGFGFFSKFKHMYSLKHG